MNNDLLLAEGFHEWRRLRKPDLGPFDSSKLITNSSRIEVSLAGNKKVMEESHIADFFLEDSRARLRPEPALAGCLPATRSPVKELMEMRRVSSEPSFHLQRNRSCSGA